MSRRIGFLKMLLAAVVVLVGATGLAQAQVSPGDMNCDGTVNGLDIAPFIDCLLTGNCPPCPTGSCCQPDGTCAVTLEAACTGVWTMFGTCDPNPCLVVIETVAVGNPGNAGELSGEGAGGYGPDRICGAVDYVYNIGKYEVTAGQYTEFLNKVAVTDTYGLYNTNMDTAVYYLGCNIKRSGSSGSYTYTVGNGSPTDVANWASRPVNLVSWGDSARFSNWLHNGQPTGPQGLSTTEDGSYYLNGATSDAALLAVVREPDATWVIASEDEWYKAAYHKNDGVTGNYWDYPTSSNSTPSNDLIDPDPGNNANFYQSGYTIGSPYYRTPVGEFENSDGPYGTFDQGGNVWEWDEAILYGSFRGLRGGSFDGYGGGYGDYLRASDRYINYPANEDSYVGFRVSEVH